MQCFICVTYMIIMCTAKPPIHQEIASQHAERSLFRDVIESLRIHSQIPDEVNQNEDNNLSHSYERYGYENEPLQLPSDADFIPRRNDRIEMPPMKYRIPKNLKISDDENDKSKEEVVIFINTTKEPKVSTEKPKKKKPKPTPNRNKFPNREGDNEDAEDGNAPNPELPLTNTMAGQSQIGNRDSQMVLKPTVIVNVRGTVSNNENDIRLEGRKNKNDSLSGTRSGTPHNIFNINQEIKLERTISGMSGKAGNKNEPNKVRQEIKVFTEKSGSKAEEDMMMCETATWNPEKEMRRESRQYDNVLQILLSI